MSLDKSSVPFSPFNRQLYKSKQPIPGEPSRTRQKTAKDHSDNVLSYYQSSIPNESQSYPRSTSPENPPATRPTHHTRKLSTTSISSSSDYSHNSETTDARGVSTEASSGVTRRSGAPSKGGADRRRVAIVQIGSVKDEKYKASSDTFSTTGSIRSRRGHQPNLAGLSLVAPPDAALRTYTRLTPPPTAPISANSNLNSSTLTAHQDNKRHYRSASEVTKYPSRDAGSMNYAQGPKPNEASRTKERKYNNGNAPRMQETRPSRSPSPAHSTISSRGGNEKGLLSPPDSSYPSLSAISMFSPIVTPDIGEGKEIHVPVAAPVVVNLDNLKLRKPHSRASSRSESPSQAAYTSGTGNSSSFITSTSSAHLRYEAENLTSVPPPAGSLPPPRTNINLARSNPPPPRPPRLLSPSPAKIRGDVEAVKHALQRPTVLASKSPSPPTKISDEHQDTHSLKGFNGGDSESCHTNFIHRREGASLSNSLERSAAEVLSVTQIPLPDSSVTISTEPSVTKKDQTVNNALTKKPTDVPSVTIDEAPTPNTQPPEKPDYAKFDEWLKENPQLTQPFQGDSGKRAHSLEDPRRNSAERSLSPTSSENNGDAPCPPPKSLRNSLTNNFKRLSALPRTPSRSSHSRRLSSEYSSRAPSPLLPAQKVKSRNPAALFCHEVYSQNTTLQRCAIYADKINELYLHDCGLSEWLIETKTRGQNTRPQQGSTHPVIPHARQTSRSSLISEATFPIRPDASTATDLSKDVYRDITPPGVPLLPYPSLALNPPRSQPTRSNSSVGSGTPPPSVRSLAPALSTKGAGFFASLGRKGSISSSKKDRFPPGISTPPGPISAGAVIGAAKNSPKVLNISRPMNITSPPSTVPSGPRAPPNRVKRSQTFMSAVSPTSLSYRGRDDPLARRPSLFNLTQDSVVDLQPNPVFSHQVDKLHALLPHADRDTLAGYLHRAGQDMLAIGQYMEDERMGTIRRSDLI